jgi:hypothetical protein
MVNSGEIRQLSNPTFGITFTSSIVLFGQILDYLRSLSFGLSTKASHSYK